MKIPGSVCGYINTDPRLARTNALNLVLKFFIPETRILTDNHFLKKFGKYAFHIKNLYWQIIMYFELKITHLMYILCASFIKKKCILRYTSWEIFSMFYLESEKLRFSRVMAVSRKFWSRKIVLLFRKIIWKKLFGQIYKNRVSVFVNSL